MDVSLHFVPDSCILVYLFYCFRQDSRCCLFSLGLLFVYCEIGKIFYHRRISHLLRTFPGKRAVAADLTVAGGWRADRACSTFPSDRAEGIKTVSNSEPVRQEGVGQQGLSGLCLHWALQNVDGLLVHFPSYSMAAVLGERANTVAPILWTSLRTVSFPGAFAGSN